MYGPPAGAFAIAPDRLSLARRSVTLVWNRSDAPNASPISAPGLWSTIPPRMPPLGMPPAPDLASCDPEAMPIRVLLSDLAELAAPNLRTPKGLAFAGDTHYGSCRPWPIRSVPAPKTHLVRLLITH